MPTCIFGVGPLGLVGPVAEAQLAPPKGRACLCCSIYSSYVCTSKLLLSEISTL
jgi:hypothetical protein